MKYRELGKSGVKITQITLGAWAIDGWVWGGIIGFVSWDEKGQEDNFSLPTSRKAFLYIFIAGFILG